MNPKDLNVFEKAGEFFVRPNSRYLEHWSFLFTTTPWSLLCDFSFCFIELRDFQSTWKRGKLDKIVEFLEFLSFDPKFSLVHSVYTYTCATKCRNTMAACPIPPFRRYFHTSGVESILWSLDYPCWAFPRPSLICYPGCSVTDVCLYFADSFARGGRCRRVPPNLDLMRNDEWSQLIRNASQMMKTRADYYTRHFLPPLTLCTR